MSKNLRETTTEHLNGLCQTMAQDLSVYFTDSGREEYEEFLNMMYHYTLKSGDRLRIAAETAVQPQLKQLFRELAEEEQYHYRLAQSDLISMGNKPSTLSPPQPLAFHDYWMSISANNQFEYVGALYVLENIASYIKPYLLPHFTRLALQPSQLKFIMTHLVADEDHGQRIQELSDLAQGVEIEQVLNGGLQAQKFWMDIHIASLA